MYKSILCISDSGKKSCLSPVRLFTRYARFFLYQCFVELRCANPTYIDAVVRLPVLFFRTIQFGLNYRSVKDSDRVFVMGFVK